MSYVEQRDIIYGALGNLVKDNFADVECVAGTAVAGIAPCSFVAQQLNLPMVFVRGEAKKHGTKRQIEGSVAKGTWGNPVYSLPP